ncbi:hypothetical protein Ciccas_007078, partial [Cichlidogyrus casuarinus]
MQFCYSTEQLHRTLPSYAFTRTLAQLQNSQTSFAADHSEESIYCQLDEANKLQVGQDFATIQPVRGYAKNTTQTNRRLKQMPQFPGASLSTQNLAPNNYENVNFGELSQAKKRRSRSWSIGLNQRRPPHPQSQLHHPQDLFGSINYIPNQYRVPANYPNRGGPGYIPLSPMDLQFSNEFNWNSVGKRKPTRRDNREANKDGYAYRRGQSSNYRMFPLSAANNQKTARLNYLQPTRYSKADSLDSTVPPIGTAMKLLSSGDSFVWNNNQPMNFYENPPDTTTHGNYDNLSRKSPIQSRHPTELSTPNRQFYAPTTDGSTEEEEINDDFYSQVALPTNSTLQKTLSIGPQPQNGRHLSPIPGSLSKSIHRDNCNCILCLEPARRHTREHVLSGLIAVESVYDTPPIVSIADEHESNRKHTDRLHETHFPAEDHPEVPMHGKTGMVIYEESEKGQTRLTRNSPGLKLPYQNKNKTSPSFVEVQRVSSPTSYPGADPTSFNDSLFINST